MPSRISTLHMESRRGNRDPNNGKYKNESDKQIAKTFTAANSSIKYNSASGWRVTTGRNSSE